jgi:nucleoid-associated protein YgaU
LAITSVPETRPAIQVAPEPMSASRELSPPTRPNAATAAVPAPAPATANQRIHVVVKGDTLSSLSRRYYQTPTRFRDIYAANRDKMRSENDLQIGMRLVIPQ